MSTLGSQTQRKRQPESPKKPLMKTAGLHEEQLRTRPARADDSVLDQSAEAIEIEDIEARVAELERAAKVNQQ
jgi:hypothetical protein